jgi:prefoldin subunit 5
VTSDDLIVDIGDKKFVKKSVEETQNIIDEQIKKLEEVKAELDERLNEINEELTKVFMEAQNKKS